MVARKYTRERKKKIVGVYIERRRMRASVEKIESENQDREHLEVGLVETYDRPIDPCDPESAIKELGYLADRLRREHDKPDSPLEGIGIGCYGPFVSLKRIPEHEDMGFESPMLASKDYGKLSDDVSPPPFTGVDLYSIFRKPFGDNSRIPIAIQTDVNVAALGEAWRRTKGIDDVVVALGLDEGMGGGFVGGRRLFETALHSEMGRMLMKVVSDDPLLLMEGFEKEEEHLGILTGIPAMLARAAILYKKGEINRCDTLGDVMDIDHPLLWRLVAKYIANLCWSCTATLSPSDIVLGGPMAAAPFLLDHVREQFREIIKAHRAPSPFIIGGQSPSFKYPQLDRWDYISFETDWRLRFGLAGAVYLAWLATRERAGVIYPAPESRTVKPPAPKDD